MKLFYSSFTALLLFCSCYSQDNLNIVKRYYEALNTSDFNLVKNLIYNSITLTEGDFVMPYTQSSFYTHFQWDSVFMPHYSIIDIDSNGNVVSATISCTSERFRFLENNPLISKKRITLRHNKIYMIETLDYVGNDFSIWQSKRDTLVKWVNINYNELSGFINDLTKTGAENYMKAIQLYNDSNN